MRGALENVLTSSRLGGSVKGTEIMIEILGVFFYLLVLVACLRILFWLLDHLI